MSCNIYFYAVLAIVSNSYPRYQAGYLRVTHPFATHHPEKQAPPSAFYLHVLGTPPAFVLSQDQTLIKSLSSHSFLSLTDLLFFIVQYYNLSYSALHIGSSCSVFKGLCHACQHFLKLFKLFSSSASTATYHSPYGIRTRVTAVKRRCLNP